MKIIIFTMVLYSGFMLTKITNIGSVVRTSFL